MAFRTLYVMCNDHFYDELYIHSYDEVGNAKFFFAIVDAIENTDILHFLNEKKKHVLEYEYNSNYCY